MSVESLAPAIGPRQARLEVAADPESVRLVRRFVCVHLRAWGLAEVEDEAALAVTELASNAVRHSGSDSSVKVEVLAEGPVAVIAVIDGGPQCALTARTVSVDDAEGGRGLQIVATLAVSWGSYPLEDGKAVWFSLALPEAPTASATVENLRLHRIAGARAS